MPKVLVTYPALSHSFGHDQYPVSVSFWSTPAIHIYDAWIFMGHYSASVRIQSRVMFVASLNLQMAQGCGWINSPTANPISCTLDPSRTIFEAIPPEQLRIRFNKSEEKLLQFSILVSSINFLGGQGSSKHPKGRFKTHTHHFRECRERYAKELSWEGEDWSDFALHPVATVPQSMLRTKILRRAVLYCYQNHKGTLERRVLRDVSSPK